VVLERAIIREKFGKINAEMSYRNMLLNTSKFELPGDYHRCHGIVSVEVYRYLDKMDRIILLFRWLDNLICPLG